MGWRAAERNPHFCQRPWQAALLAAAVVAMVALVQAQGEFLQKPGRA
jgi:hypothetical protein